MICAGAVRANGARTENPLTMPSPRPRKSVKSLLGISTDAKSTDWRARCDDFRQPCGQACTRTKQEGDRGSGHAKGRVRQRRAAQVGERIVSSRRLQVREERANGNHGRSAMPTIGGRRGRAVCLTAAGFWELVKHIRRLGLDVDTAGAQGWACGRDEMRWREWASCMSCMLRRGCFPTVGDGRLRRVCYDLEYQLG